MAFYTFQLERLAAQNIRSRTTDVDLITFGVLVNGRDQGHGSALVPIWPGTVLNAEEIMPAAAVNGYPHAREHMSANWEIGPLEVSDSDQIAIVYTATNTSDSQIPTADQQAVDAWTIKLVDIYYSYLLGEFASGLGLSAVTEYFGSLGGKVGGAVAAFLSDPVGTALGVKPQGPCNGTVFADSKSFTGATLGQLPSTPSQETRWNVTIPTAWSELTEHYSDEATHNKDTCGDTAQTDVTIKITRYDHWSLKFATNQSLASGLRLQFPSGGSLKELYGLRI
ncbi:MAG: hypothetical protein ACR2NR_08450 [Solirubrobacteraceae bacterium]